MIFIYFYLLMMLMRVKHFNQDLIDYIALFLLYCTTFTVSLRRALQIRNFAGLPYYIFLVLQYQSSDIFLLGFWYYGTKSSKLLTLFGENMNRSNLFLVLFQKNVSVPHFATELNANGVWLIMVARDWPFDSKIRFLIFHLRYFQLCGVEINMYFTKTNKKCHNST